MNIRKMNHSCLKAKNIDKTTDFYKNILGFKEAFTILDGNGKKNIVFLHIGKQDFLELSPAGENEDFNPQHAHMCYEVDDIHAAYVEMTAKGVPTESAVRKGKTLCEFFFIQDPDGNRVELMQAIPGSYQEKAYKDFQ